MRWPSRGHYSLRRSTAARLDGWSPGRVLLLFELDVWSAIGLASVFARRLMERVVAGNARGGLVLERGLNVGGSLALVLFASLLLLGAWSRL